MQEKSKKKSKEKPVNKFFYENPYDIETCFEGLQASIKNGKELQYVDRFISKLRADPTQDITTIIFNILKDFDILKLDKK